ncbi:UbiA family prenyltransferase [Nannocystis pusilla]|uniref:UbiA family prenyltransferase n=1 Tax=Nannocystis pusilla TaxID=889268 RepID=A0A9X3F045_9BACT|nr:UbiA family prenyltransferase [Nannocystis pusilla]
MTAAPAPWLVVRRLGGLVRFSHTVFGLPFALAAVALAHRHALAHGGAGLDLGRLALIVLAFTAARTAAMGFNRIVDRRIDAANPRTAMRELPAGLVSLRAAVLLTVLSALAFLGCAWLLGPVPLLLAPGCLIVVLAYSLFKDSRGRPTWCSGSPSRSPPAARGWPSPATSPRPPPRCG